MVKAQGKNSSMPSRGHEKSNAAEQAAGNIAEGIMRRFHRSPPKTGPLAEHGDAAIYAGKQFGKSYATGLESGSRTVGTAAGRVAGAAGSGVSGGNIQNDKNYQAGKFLGQAFTLINFAQHAVDAFSKLTETIISAAKFMSDPLGQGTFFGQNRKWRRDPKISDAQLAQQRAAAAQERSFSFHESGQRPDLYDPATGRIKGPATGALGSGAGSQQIANYIIDKALSLGYSREQANMFLIQAVGESGLNPAATSPNGLWKGIFQFDVPTWREAGGGNVMDPQQNIDNYFNLAAQRLLTPENFKSGSQLGNQVSIGGPWADENAPTRLAQAQSEAQQFIQGYQPGVGQTTSGVVPGMPAAPANKPSILRDEGPVPSSLASQLAAAFIQANFPEIKDILGSDTGHVPGTHDAGKSIDIFIPNYNTPQGKALGDRINDALQANAKALGLDATIWQNKWKRASDGYVSPNDQPGHYDHIDAHFPTGMPGINPDGTVDWQVPVGSNARYGLPPKPEDKTPAPRELVIRNPDPNGPPFIPIHGTGDQPGNIPINPFTGQPWTPEESTAFWNRPENAKQYDNSLWRPGDDTMPGVFQGTRDEMTEAIKANNPDLAAAIATAEGYGKSTNDVASALDILTNESERQKKLNTPESNAKAGYLDSVISSAASEYGLAQEENPFDVAANIAGAASSIAGSIFSVVDSAFGAINGAKDLTDTLLRGVENTEDLYKMVDQIQTFITLAGDIAGAVSDVTGAISGIVGAAGGAAGGADMGAHLALPRSLAQFQRFQGLSNLGLIQSMQLLILDKRHTVLLARTLGNILEWLLVALTVLLWGMSNSC